MNTSTAKLTDDFDRLMDSYAQLFKMAHDALGPGKTQEERNVVRAALKDYLAAK
jgi:hypothetical protein